MGDGIAGLHPPVGRKGTPASDRVCPTTDTATFATGCGELVGSVSRVVTKLICSVRSHLGSSLKTKLHQPDQDVG